jgi:hypothetical protein
LLSKAIVYDHIGAGSGDVGGTQEVVKRLKIPDSDSKCLSMKAS